MRARFTIHPTRVVGTVTAFGPTITFESLETARFSSAPARPLAEDERLYINGAFTAAELERIVAWARGTG